MRPALTRLIAGLLAVSLVCDPAFAAGLLPFPSSVSASQKTQTVIFEQQATPPPVVAARFWTPLSKVMSVAVIVLAITALASGVDRKTPSALTPATTAIQLGSKKKKRPSISELKRRIAPIEKETARRKQNTETVSSPSTLPKVNVTVILPDNLMALA